MSEHDDLRRHLEHWDPATRVSEAEAEQRLARARRQALEAHRARAEESWTDGASWRRPRRLLWVGAVAAAAMMAALILPRVLPVDLPHEGEPRVASHRGTVAESPETAEPIRTVLVASNGTRIYWSTTP